MNDVETLNVETPGASCTGKKGLSDKNKKILLIILTVGIVLLIGLFIGYKFF